MLNRKIHTFYFREKWDTVVRSQSKRVGALLRSLLVEDRKAKHGATEDSEDVVNTFLRKLRRVQTSHKMKRNSRLTAAVYRFKTQEVCVWTVPLDGKNLRERGYSIEKRRAMATEKIASVTETDHNLVVSVQSADVTSVVLRATADVLPCMTDLFSQASHKEYKTIFEYGFSTFINRGGESFQKKKLRATALRRLAKSPERLVEIRTRGGGIPRFDRHATLQWAIKTTRYHTLTPPSLHSTDATDASSEDGAQSLDWDISRSAPIENGKAPHPHSRGCGASRTERQWS